MTDAVTTLIDTLKRQGVMLTPAGDKLEIEAPDGILTPELIEQLRRHKPEILLRLCRSIHWHPNYWQDEPPEKHRIRTVCRLCGNLIGYRPVTPSTN